jgi:DGQHR domain-containing protein
MSKASLTFEVLQISQPVGTFYGCSLPAKDLLRICTFDFRRIEENNGVKEFLGIQRPLKKDRVREIRKYIATEDASFPTSIVISVDERCASISGTPGGQQIIKLDSYIDPTDPDLIIPFTAIATIIDGQHRLKAFEGTSFNWNLSVNLLVGADEGTQAMIFSKVNLAQTKVNKSLVYDLFSLDRGRSPEKTSHEIVVALNDAPESPFYQKIKRLGSATEGVFGETLSQATVVKGILPLITNDPLTDRDIGRRIGYFPDRGQKDFSRRIFYPLFRDRKDAEVLAILLHFFGAVKDRWPEAWAFSGAGAVLSKTNGYNALIRYMRDAYLYIASSPRVVRKEEFATILTKSSLVDSDFTVENFKPGSSGSAELYRRLSETLHP